MTNAAAWMPAADISPSSTVPEFATSTRTASPTAAPTPEPVDTLAEATPWSRSGTPVAAAMNMVVNTIPSPILEVTMSKYAEAFRRLHAGPELLLLANCWDAGSARLIESLGARAIATTSAGVAWANGYPDGNLLPLERLIATVGAIVRVIQVPLSVDVEAGYSDDPVAVGELVAAVVGAGAVGINIEDGASPPGLLAAKIERAKQAATRSGVDLFVNARTDVYLGALVDEPVRLAETLARARRYRDAGADGLFVPKLIDPAEIREVVASAQLPVNLLTSPSLPPAAELTTLGVRRLSAGSAIAAAVWGRAAALASAFLADGSSEAPSQGPKPYAEMNALFSGR